MGQWTRLWGMVALAGLGVPLSAQSGSGSFTKDVLPILKTRCWNCHGAAQQIAGYDLRTRDAAVGGGAKGTAIVPGNAEASPLFQRLTGTLQPAMPLGGKLKDAEIAIIRRWIDAGATWDESASAASAKPAVASGHKSVPADDRNWWAFQKPVRHRPPPSEPRWNKNPIDAFIFARLQERDLRPAPQAGQSALLRRAYLDLTGLPPDPQEASAFLEDRSPDAFAKLIERLLASPRYGERWGRHWLDVARYGDSGGYEQDFNYPNAWRYRDYVIRAFNQDKPYDRFIREQIAGDELDDSDYDALIATGFHRVGATVGFREKDNPQYRYIYLDDMLGTTTRAFLGLTVSCARCHDHKFDPISQMDYYRLTAIFYPYVNYEHPLAPPEEIAAYQSRKNEIESSIKPLQERLRAIEAPYRKRAFEQKLATFPEDIQIAVRTAPELRTEGQKLLATQVQTIRPSNFRSFMSAEDRSAADKLSQQIRSLERSLPKPLPTAMGVRDGDYRLSPLGPGDDEAPGKGVKTNQEDLNSSYVPARGEPYTPPKAYFLEHGDYLSRGPEVQPGFLEVIGDPNLPAANRPTDGRITTGRRRALAEWIASKDNPLTARVMVNRIWQHHFGRGLVSTASNFGKLGRRPSHPELLDWLATEFMRSGWSVKHMHRLIMTSETYRMASDYNSAQGLQIDPDNTYLWRFPLRRLEGEAIRDLVLAVSGNLNLEAGGPPYFPPVPERVRESVSKGIWQVNEEGPAVWRRGVYSYFKRGMKYPMFEVFDQPDPNVTCEARTVSTVPTQALTLLNNDFVIRQSRAFAERVARLSGSEQEAQVRFAYRLAFSRDPSAAELRENVAFLNRQMGAHGDASNAALEALTDLCDVIINLNEFVYIQ